MRFGVIGIFLLFFFFLCFHNVMAQEDSLYRGTIRIGKKKSDTVYVKASLVFKVFAPTDQKIGKSYFDYVKATGEMAEMKVGEIHPPHPALKDSKEHFDYTSFFNRQYPDSLKTDSEGNDTVLVRVDVRNNGKFYYKDLSKMTRIGQQIVVFDPKRNVYVVSQTHRFVMQALKKIPGWDPAYSMIPMERRLKGVVVIKPVKKQLHASGTLMVVFSETPFTD